MQTNQLTESPTQTTWYAKETGCGGQALVIDEQTGRDIAVAYEAKDAPLLAAAPELLAACEMLSGVYRWAKSKGKRSIVDVCDWSVVDAAIAKAKEEQ